MYFDITKRLLVAFLTILLFGCGSSTGGEQSETTLLDEAGVTTAPSKGTDSNNSQPTGELPGTTTPPKGTDSPNVTTNRAPIAYDIEVSTDEDSTIELLLRGEDPDGDRINFKILTQPKNGTLSATVPHLTYAPKPNFYGTDSFTYMADDTKANSNVATVTIAVNAVNDAPMANDDNVTTPEDSSIAIDPLLNDIDPDGDRSDLHIVSIAQPHLGIALLDAGRVYYAPPSGHAQEDSFTYTIEDKHGARATGVIHIKIIGVNEAPIAYSQKVHTTEESPVSFELNATDPDADTINYHTILLPKHGTISGNAPFLSYLPDRDFSGEDYVTYSVDDGNLSSDVAVVSIVVEPINDPPVANAGKDTSVIPGDTIHFDASGSFDKDGNITSYLWREGGSILSTERIFDRKMLGVGVHTITLTVTDDQNATDTDEKVVTIKPCCEGCVYPDPTQTNPFK